ncbi:MAG: ester cyclase [Candidatus Methanoperedens sp.]|nr:ester cyclase [Candidatus Methanoperedens sp.]
MNKEEQIKYASDQLVGQGNLDVIGEIFSTDYIAHAGDKNYKRHGFIKRFAGQIRSAIPDIQVIKVEFLAQAGNMITWQRTLSGTHKADMMGIPPSGRKVTWTDMVVSRFEDEKIAEEWVVSELAGELLLKLLATK